MIKYFSNSYLEGKRNETITNTEAEDTYIRQDREMFGHFVV